MIKIKLRKIGRKKVPSYRIVVIPSRKSPTSKYIEDIGFYDSKTGESKVNTERAKYWLSVGAKPSSTVYMLFYKNEIVKKAPEKKTKIVKKEEK